VFEGVHFIRVSEKNIKFSAKLIWRERTMEFKVFMQAVYARDYQSAATEHLRKR